MKDKITISDGKLFNQETGELIGNVKNISEIEERKIYTIPAFPLEEKTFKDILIENGTFIFTICMKFVAGLLYIYSVGLIGTIFGAIAALIYLPISFWLVYSIYEYFFTDRRIW